jgi:hypothetical protein
VRVCDFADDCDLSHQMEDWLERSSDVFGIL